MTGNTNTDLRTGVVGGLGAKAPCRVASFTNLILEGLQTVNGIALIENDRVLVKSQDDATENGIYIASTGEWQRAVDFDDELDGVSGSLIAVNEGNGFQEQSSKTLWIVQCDDTPIIFGTSEINFDFFALASQGGGTYLIAGNNLNDVEDASASRENIGLEIGVDVQGYNANLQAIAGLTSSANTIPSFTGSGTAALLTIGTASGNVPSVGTTSATESLAGLAELATQAETIAGASGKIVDPQKLLALFNASVIGADSYFRIPIKIGSAFSEFIIQTGTYSSGSTGTKTFPLSFPNACLSVVLTATNGDNSDIITSLNATGFSWANAGAFTPNGYWVAFGY